MLRGMKKLIVKPSEHHCPECKGTGSVVANHPTRPGVRIYPARCEKCLGKGSVAAD
jgi:DnaJ-class molecular chaperone